MGFRDRVLTQVGDKIAEETKQKAEKPEKVIRTKKTAAGTDAVTVQEIRTQTEFKAVRHLVEYLLVRDKDIKFNATESIVKRAFPGQMYDAGLFMMVKLDIIRNKRLIYREEIKVQLPDAGL